MMSDSYIQKMKAWSLLHPSTPWWKWKHCTPSTPNAFFHYNGPSRCDPTHPSCWNHKPPWSSIMRFWSNILFPLPPYLVMCLSLLKMRLEEEDGQIKKLVFTTLWFLKLGQCITLQLFLDFLSPGFNIWCDWVNSDKNPMIKNTYRDLIPMSSFTSAISVYFFLKATALD